jgi:hypothetical protein
MLKIIGFVTGMALTAVVVLVFAGNVGGAGARGEFGELLESVSSDPRRPETDSAISTGSEGSDINPYSAKAALERIADATANTDTHTDPPLPEQPDPIAQAPETGEIEPPPELLGKQLADAPVVAASDGLPEAENAPGEVADATSPTESDDIGAWHAFWTPFRSEASANGFAAGLGRSTDREYRVIRTGPGEYRVAFFHIGENDRRARLVEIEQVSGLVLGGGEF